MKTSQEMWLLLRHFITFFYRLTFSPITDRNYQVTWKTWFCPITYAITLLSTLYTIYIRRHELLATMCDFCISGLLLTVICQQFNFFLTSIALFFFLNLLNNNLSRPPYISIPLLVQIDSNINV